jgi:hypothetical protein
MKQATLFQKKNPFINASRIIMNALFLILVIISCTKKTNEIPTTANSEEVAVAKASKPNTLPGVSLNVTVREVVGDKITSDGGGSYVSGSQSVSAIFDQYGNFIFSCGTSGHGPSATLVRWLNINFDSPIQIFINPPITGNDKVTAITTIVVAAFTFIPLQNLVVGQSECVGLTGGSGAEWVMNFHRNAEDVSSSPSSYAVFTRINSTQWTVTPVGSCSPNSNVCALRNGPGTLYGYYNMPFAFTLTAQ